MAETRALITMPAEPPEELVRLTKVEGGFDQQLFEACRNDEYAQLYRIFVSRYAVRS